MPDCDPSEIDELSEEGRGVSAPELEGQALEQDLVGNGQKTGILTIQIHKQSKKKHDWGLPRRRENGVSR